MLWVSYVKVLFWNTHKNRNINHILAEIIVENNASIVVLAEYIADVSDLISMLSMSGIEMKQYICICPRIVMIGAIDNVEPRLDSDYATFQIINGSDILCGIHLNSKLHSGHEGFREILIEQIIHDLRKIEQDIGSENSIIVGDFNINPYDSSCIDARFFHSIPILEEAERKTRVVAGKEYSIFYNPMWNLLGDYSIPYGTYYCNSGEILNTYWNIFDQVIFKPALKSRFVKDSLKIISETSVRFLLDGKGHPDKEISDHLPIIFEITEDISL